MKKISKKLLLAGLLAIAAAAPVEAGLVSRITGLFAACANRVFNTCFPETYQHWLYTYVYSPGEITRDFKKLGLEPVSSGRIARQAILVPFVVYELGKKALYQANQANKTALNLKKKQGVKPFVKE